MTRRSQARNSGSARRAHTVRGGFTVIESLVAILILSIGVLGLAGTSGALTKQIALSRRQMRATSIVRQRVERLGAAANCAAIAAPGVVVKGTATGTTTGVVEKYAITGGQMIVTVLDSVTIPPLKNPVVIQTAIRCQ